MPMLQMLDLSTEHITKNDAIKLDSFDDVTRDGALAYDKGEYGWFVHVPESGDVLQTMLADMAEAGYSEMLRNLLQYAHDKGAHWICLDRDAEAEPDLPTVDWWQ